jgi:hypothetical protein
MTEKSYKSTRARPPGKPTNSTACEQMAEAGDVEGLWQYLAVSDWTLFNHEETFRLLLRAIQVQSAQDPARFAQDIFSRLLGFTTCLVCRSHYYIAHQIRMADRLDQGRGTQPLPREVTHEYLPPLVALQGHLAELAQAQASTMRLWELARQRRLENDRIEHGRGRRRRHPPTFPPPDEKAVPTVADREPANRLAGLLGDLP